MNDPVQATRLLPLPYTAPDGKLHSSIRSPVWTGPHTVTYLAEMLFYEGSTFYPDTFFTGLEVAQLEVSQMPAAVQVIPD